MSYLSHIELYDADYQQALRSAHATQNVEYVYALALDTCRVKTRAVSRLNITSTHRARALFSLLKPLPPALLECWKDA